MYTVRTINELQQNHPELKKYHDGGFKLCFIDRVEEYESVYTKRTEEYLKSEQYKKNQKKYDLGRDPNIETMWVPNKRFIPGFQKYEAYFTPLPLTEQWGDDVDDIPYEYNAGIPYDTNDKNSKEHEILIIPFTYPEDVPGCVFEAHQPKDYGGGNSHWSVEDINLGAIPWLFGRTYRRGRGGKRDQTEISISINAGDSPLVFMTKLIEMFSSVKCALKGTGNTYRNYSYEKTYQRGKDEVVHAFYSSFLDEYTFIDDKTEKPVSLSWPESAVFLCGSKHPVSTPSLADWTDYNARDFGFAESPEKKPSKEFLDRVYEYLNKDPWLFYEK